MKILKVMECVTSPIGTQQMNLIQKTIWSTLSNMKAAQQRQRRGPAENISRPVHFLILPLLIGVADAGASACPG